MRRLGFPYVGQTASATLGHLQYRLNYVERRESGGGREEWPIATVPCCGFKGFLQLCILRIRQP